MGTITIKKYQKRTREKKSVKSVKSVVKEGKM